MISYAQNPAYLAYAERILGVSYTGQTVILLTSLDQSGSILGVVIFSRFTEGNCEITVASHDPRFITKKFALAVALYPFGQLKCRRVTAIIAVDNSKSLNLAQQLGFRIEGTLKSWYASGDAFILGLLREDCTWLKARNVKVPHNSPA